MKCVVYTSCSDIIIMSRKHEAKEFKKYFDGTGRNHEDYERTEHDSKSMWIETGLNFCSFNK